MANRARQVRRADSARGSEALDVRCGRALGALDDLELDRFAVVQALVALTGDRRMVDETVLLTIFTRDETETLLSVELLHCTL